MKKPARKVAFVVVATDHGTLIVNRFDRHVGATGLAYGVGNDLLNNASYEADEVRMVLELLNLRRDCYGEGVVAVDGGANVGVHTVEWSKHMANWGQVLAIEAQERIYYALAGNIALNNCFGARAIHAALSAGVGIMKMPKLDYASTSSFGSLELKKRAETEFIGQAVDYSESAMIDVRTISLDSLGLQRVDLVKLDIEGMELDALAGAENCIRNCRPILIVETIKSDKQALRRRLENLGYLSLDHKANVVAIHHEDKCLPIINDRAARADAKRSLSL